MEVQRPQVIQEGLVGAQEEPSRGKRTRSLWPWGRHPGKDAGDTTVTEERGPPMQCCLVPASSLKLPADHCADMHLIVIFC